MLSLTKLISYVVDNFTPKITNNNQIISPPKNILADNKIFLLPYGKNKTISDFSPKIKKIFDPFISEMKRHGSYVNNVNNVNKEDNKEDIKEDIKVKIKLNMSLMYSILFTIDDKLQHNNNISNISEYVNNFNNSLLKLIYSEDLYNKFNYVTLNWNKKELLENLKQYKNNSIILRFLTDVLHVNIFLLNNNEDKIYAIYPEDKFNSFKSNIFLSYYDGVFEPVTYKNFKTFSYSTEPFKKLINVDKQIIISSLDGNLTDNKVNKLFDTEIEDLTKYLEVKEIKVVKVKENSFDEDEVEDEVEDKNKVENKEEKVITDLEVTETLLEDNLNKKNNKDIFCKNKNKMKTIKSNKYNLNIKMKLPELQEIATKNNIIIITKEKNKTKQELIDELNLLENIK